MEVRQAPDMKVHRRHDNRGFTLVELMVVLVILVLLASIMVPAFLGYVDKTRDDAKIADLRTVVSAAEAYRADRYTTKGANCKIDSSDYAGILSLAGAESGITIEDLKLTSTKKAISLLVIKDEGEYVIYRYKPGQPEYSVADTY